MRRSGARFFSGLQAILDATIATMGADKGNIQLLDRSSGCLRLAVQRGFHQPFLEFFAEVRPEEAARCGQAFHCAGRVVVEDVERSEIFAGQLVARCVAVRRRPCCAIHAAYVCRRRGVRHDFDALHGAA